MPRGQKTCESCKKVTGPRTKVCECGYAFSFKPKDLRKPKTQALVDWKELVPGDRIQVKKGSGPYWMTADNEKVCIGYRGIFRVKYIDSKGIHAYPIKSTEAGHCYIYMGPKAQSPTGTIMRKHRIRKIKQEKKQ